MKSPFLVLPPLEVELSLSSLKSSTFLGFPKFSLSFVNSQNRPLNDTIFQFPLDFPDPPPRPPPTPEPPEIARTALTSVFRLVSPMSKIIDLDFPFRLTSFAFSP